MIHKASRLEVILHSRSDGRSAVKSAAYCARASYRDARIGKRFSHTRKGGLLSHELINWSGDAEALWNAAEKAETRVNARVVRELRPSLPAELPLDAQVRLVRSFSLWLSDTYGVAVQANVHAPRFKTAAMEKRLNDDRSDGAGDRYVEALFEPELTNLNFHAHILMTTRAVDPETGAFGLKTAALDRKKTGPAEVTRIRQEWEKRTNAALVKANPEANTGGHIPWTLAEIETFRDRWPYGTKECLAFEMQYWAGARISDTGKLGAKNVGDQGWLNFVQQKTRSEVSVPLYRELPDFAEPDHLQHLLRALEAMEGKEDIWLATRSGNVRSAKSASSWFSKKALAAGLPPGRTSHGLRKSRMILHAENGATSKQIAAWSGHETLKEIERYIRNADRRRLLMPSALKTGKFL